MSENIEVYKIAIDLVVDQQATKGPLDQIIAVLQATQREVNTTKGAMEAMAGALRDTGSATKKLLGYMESVAAVSERAAAAAGRIQPGAGVANSLFGRSRRSGIQPHRDRTGYGGSWSPHGCWQQLHISPARHPAAAPNL